MKEKSHRVLYISISMLVLFIIIGVSFAYFRAQTTNNENSTTIATRSIYLEITFADGTPVISGTDIAPGWSATKSFTVTNTGEGTAFYSLKIFDIANTYVAEGIKYSIASSDGGQNISKSVLPTVDTVLEGNNRIITGATHHYTITVYYDNLDVNQVSDMGKSFSFKVGIVGSRDPSLPKEIDHGVLGEGNSNVSTPLTTPGRLISSIDEAVLASTPDDYGTSYYYRGNVTNNYVVFAGMCWRIVRMTGLDDIKIILYNYNPNNAENPCDTSQDGTSNAFARYDGTNYSTLFNNERSDQSSVGFMYGTAGASDYATCHANNNKSLILQELEQWYNSKLSSYGDFLADVVWCNDKSKSTEAASYHDNKDYGNYSGRYKSDDRLWLDASYQTTAHPSLICPDDDNGGKLSKFTTDDTTYGNGNLDYRIGLITADEAAFAGLIYNTTNTNTYLTNNATAIDWWTMTPSFRSYIILGIGYTWNWAVTTTGGIMDYSIFSSTVRGIRPMVALRSSVLVVGDGTSTNPYVVQT
jgi:hypothetical protein